MIIQQIGNFNRGGELQKKKKKPSGNFRVEKKMNRKNSLD